MSYNAETEEYERDFPNGAWVSGVSSSGETITLGMITNFDDEDGQYYVIWPDDRDPEIVAWNEEWCDHDALKAANGPNASPEHVLIVDWTNNGFPCFEVYADPETMMERLDESLPVDTGADLRSTLMQAVADPGERIDLGDGGFHVTFKAVQGAERQSA